MVFMLAPFQSVSSLLSFHMCRPLHGAIKPAASARRCAAASALVVHTYTVGTLVEYPAGYIGTGTPLASRPGLRWRRAIHRGPVPGRAAGSAGLESLRFLLPSPFTPACGRIGVQQGSVPSTATALPCSTLPLCVSAAPSRILVAFTFPSISLFPPFLQPLSFSSSSSTHATRSLRGEDVFRFPNYLRSFDAWILHTLFFPKVVCFSFGTPSLPQGVPFFTTHNHHTTPA
ncbi:hypothetical protein B0T09DRAFT_39789 [Sordaria sp. MPI-SDFR-AT-0083]|nr:hypothetical protein B0T09DRAFT_39789 [Sordaria sp. MPI-SDFR-AT-0083]